jgi:hypothetical protein
MVIFESWFHALNTLCLSNANNPKELNTITAVTEIIVIKKAKIMKLFNKIMNIHKRCINAEMPEDQSVDNIHILHHLSSEWKYSNSSFHLEVSMSFLNNKLEKMCMVLPGRYPCICC